MKILVVYATYSSGTQIAAELIVKTFQEDNFDVTLKIATDVNHTDFSGYDLIIFGSPSWYVDGKQGQPHEYFIPLLERMTRHMFENKKFAIFGLGHSDYYLQFCGAVGYLEEAVKKTGGTLVIDSLKIDAFFFHQEANEKRLKEWTKKIIELNK